MKTCPFCRAENELTLAMCRLCGRPLISVVYQAGDDHATMSGSTAILKQAARNVPRHATTLDELFSVRKELVIGRAPDCDVCLQHPTVSRYHALLVRGPQGLVVTDLGSVNGVTVDGRRVAEPTVLREQQRVGVGPFLFALVGNTIRSLDSSRGLRLEARVLEKVVTLVSGKGTRKLLDNVTFVVEPGEFVSLLGPSGSGKSTLMDCLNGRRRATGGRVLANGEDFYHHFNTFRQSLGYVPQKDIVHGQLTVSGALSYTAQLRLPTDTDTSERHGRVEEVLAEMELLPHRDTLVGNLSGGQVKRVSLGAELLARPSVLFIDEATSGLDAGTEARMMRLFRRLADEGRSILCITHNVDNVDRCHQIIVLARGKLMYYGPPSEAPTYFGVARISDIYDRLQAKEPEVWEREFRGCSLYSEFVVKRLEIKAPLARSSDEIELPAEPAEPAEQLQAFLENVGGNVTPLPSKLPRMAQRLRELAAAAGRARELVRPASELWHQFRVLTRRYVELLWRDRKNLRLLLLQAPIVAVFVLLGFVAKPYDSRVPATRDLTEQERTVLTQAREVLKQVRDPSALTPEQHELFGRLQIAGKDIDGQIKMLDLLLDSSVPVVPYDAIVNPAYTYMLLYIVVIAVFWFGCSNAAKEIVKEQAVYGRERAVNLRIVPYLASKFLVLGVISAAQVLLLMGVLYGTLELLHATAGHPLPPAEYRLSYPAEFAILLLLALTGVAVGLMLSSCVANPDQANALLPYVLIPQMILGGGIIAVKDGVLWWLSMFLSPIYWTYRGVRRGVTALPPTSPFYVDCNDSIWLSVAALTVQIVVLMALTAWFLRRHDVQG